MPVYTYRNITTDEVVDLTMTIAEMDQYVTDHPEMIREYKSPPGTITGFHKKPENGFTDLLKDIKKANSKGFQRSNINTF